MESQSASGSGVALGSDARGAQLKLELELLVTTFDGSGTDLAAFELLVRHRLSDPEWLRQWLEFKQKRWQALLDESRRLEEMLPSG